MRTTILLDDELAERLRWAARAKGQSLSAFLAEAGRAALRTESSASDAAPFDLLTYGQEGPHPNIDLNRSNALIAAEDAENFGQ